MIYPLKKVVLLLLATLGFFSLNANSTEIIDFDQGVPYGFTLEGGMSTFDGYISDSQYDKSSTLVFPNPVFVSSLDLNALPWEDYGFDIVTSSYPIVGLDIAGNTVFEIEVDLSNYTNWDNWLTVSTFDGVAIKSLVFGPAVTEMFPSIDNIVVDLADGVDPCVLSMEPYNECVDEEFAEYNCQVYGVCPNDEVNNSETEAPIDESLTTEDVSSSTTALQQVSVDGSPVGRAGDSLDISVTYNVSDNNPSLTGLGFRLHYDSSVLTFNDFGFLFDGSLFADNEDDFNDLDNDSSTDKYITVGWVSLFSTFPGVLPQNLTTVNFSVASDTNLELTPINFTSDNTAAGYAFSSDNYVLDIVSATWDIDGNGKADALTDGLTLLKASFGLSGQSMIEGSIATDSNMTLEEIEGSMDKAMTIADIDDSGDVDALTDGLMVLRYLFGVEDSGLTEGAISTNAKREAHQSIVDHLEKHMPADM
ncbi:hypothetical protein N9I73_04020 [Porticoccaceae bacterium]|jgi:hypothetical protein|nr:hypothetical protein [Porticoccaceae bacterium]MDA9014729.1 hypothetical protein [Porticoccaceae bacterium]